MKAERTIENQEIAKFADDFSAAAEKALFVFFDERLREASRVLAGYRNRYDKTLGATVDEAPAVAVLRDFRRQVLELLDKPDDKNYAQSFTTNLNDYREILGGAANGLRTQLRRVEPFRPYRLTRHDSPDVWLRKLWLNGLYQTGRAAGAGRNLWMKLLHKQPDVRPARIRRRIPLRSMAVYYLDIRLTELLSEPLQLLMNGINSMLLDLWEFDGRLDTALQSLAAGPETEKPQAVPGEQGDETLPDRLKEQLATLRKNVHDALHDAVQRALAELDHAVQVVDTPELSRSFFSEKNKQKLAEGVNRTTMGMLGGWNNTRTTLLDDWAMDVEITLLYFSVLEHFGLLRNSIGRFVEEHLSLNFDQLRDFLKTSATRISESTGKGKTTAAMLAGERGQVNDVLIDRMLAQTIEQLSGSFTDDLEKFSSKTHALAAKIADKRSFVKSKNYTRPLRSGDINHISPRDLLGFEALPHFEEAIARVRLFVEERLEKARVKLLAMGTVSDFSLESALMMLDQKKNAVKGAAKVAQEGYERALAHLDEAVALTLEIREKPLADLQNAIHGFNTEIQKLKNSDNILELNLQIARIRAVERSRRLRRETLTWLREFIPGTVAHIRRRWSETSGLLARFRRSFGMTHEKTQISYELSEFISRTELSLKKLPFVYQRLYQLTPTDEDRFFVNRTKELAELRRAYTDWEKDRFVTTAVIGEKGSGVTSLINFFLRKNEHEIPVIRCTPEQKIYEPARYLELFAQLLDAGPFADNEALIAHLNGRSGSLIFVIENMHHFFLRKVHGFDCQHLFFDLMANTSKKVFWLASYTTHAWAYLDKTLRVSDHFVRMVPLEQLGDETLEEIIFKRNRLSGYRISFEPPADGNDSKALKKFDDSQQQELLRKQFFSGLSRISNGNVSLAQLYWLRSTRAVNEDTISIGALSEIDVSFVKDVTSDYLFALYAMLVHDGMSLEGYARVFNRSESSSRNILVPMYEKGLLIRPREKYNINPIIFRQVVNLLRSRNFIN